MNDRKKLAQKLRRLEAAANKLREQAWDLEREMRDAGINGAWSGCVSELGRALGCGSMSFYARDMVLFENEEQADAAARIEHWLQRWWENEDRDILEAEAFLRSRNVELPQREQMSADWCVRNDLFKRIARAKVAA